MLLAFTARMPDAIVNIGCAEGYYAVGLARHLPGAKVYAFDIDPKAQEACRSNALLNDVADQVKVEGQCSGARLSEIADQHSNILAIVDCEGHEKDLLCDPLSVRALQHADMIIETHDFSDRDITPLLERTFAMPHCVSRIRSGSRNPHDFAFLDRCSDIDKWLLVSENRPERQSWLVCEKPFGAAASKSDYDCQEEAPRQACRRWNVDPQGLIKSNLRPLICTAVYGEDIHYECLELMLQSLVECGKYRGEIAIFSDRLPASVYNLFASEIQKQIVCYALQDQSLMGRYSISNETIKNHSPMLYIDNDVIVNTDISPIINDLQRSRGISVSTESKSYPELRHKRIAEIHDVRRIGNWFGLDICRADASCRDEVLPVANSGIIGFCDVDAFRSMSNMVRELYRHPAHSAVAKWFGDQPFLNYALVKTHWGEYEILDSSCNFVGAEDPLPIEKRGFVHFLWARSEKKLARMKSYLELLRQGQPHKAGEEPISSNASETRS